MLSTKHFFRFICAALFVSVLASCCYAVDVTPFFKIYEDYRQNPFKAEQKWKDKTITIEGTVREMWKNDDGIPVIACAWPKPDGRKGRVIYIIGFNPKKNLPERLLNLEVGQTAKFRVSIFGFTKSEDTNDLIIVTGCYEILD